MRIRDYIKSLFYYNENDVNLIDEDSINYKRIVDIIFTLLLGIYNITSLLDYPFCNLTYYLFKDLPYIDFLLCYSKPEHVLQGYKTSVKNTILRLFIVLVFIIMILIIILSILIILLPFILLIYIHKNFGNNIEV